jgi:hypothetical protein
MRSLFLILTLAFALVACGKPKPKYPVPEGPVTAAAMKEYFKVRFPAQVADGTLILDFGSAGVENDVTTELRALGIDEMSELAAIVPDDFEVKGFGAIKSSAAPTTTVAGLMRDLMIMHDTRGYFEKAWKNSWVTSGPQDFPAPAAYGVDFKIMEELGVFSGDEADPCAGNPCDGDPCGDPCGE